MLKNITPKNIKLKNIRPDYWPSFIRWPGACATAPLNPSQGWLAYQGKTLPAIRLGFALSRLDADSALRLLRVASRWCARLYIADYTLPQRNLALPAYCLARLAARKIHRDFWRAGALWGIVARLGLEPDYEQIILGGAGALASFGEK